MDLTLGPTKEVVSYLRSQCTKQTYEGDYRFCLYPAETWLVGFKVL